MAHLFFGGTTGDENYSGRVDHGDDNSDDDSDDDISLLRHLANLYPKAVHLQDRPDGACPLHRAAFRADLDTVEVLLRAGEDGGSSPGASDAGRRAAAAVDARGRLPLHRACAGRPAAGKAWGGNDDDSSRGRSREGDRWKSDEHLRAAVVAALVAAYPQGLMASDTVDRRTPLNLACQRNPPAMLIIRALLSRKGSTMIGEETDVCLNTVLRERDRHGWTPLHHASACSNSGAVEVVAALLKAEKIASGASIAEIKTIKSDLALHVACEFGAPAPVVSLLLERHPEAMHHHNHYGFTPLMLVCRRGCWQGRDNSVIRGGNIDGNTNSNKEIGAPLFNTGRIAQLLLEKAAFVDKVNSGKVGLGEAKEPSSLRRMLGATSNAGESPLHLSIRSNSGRDSSLMEQEGPERELVQILLDSIPTWCEQILANMKDKQGNNPLHYAAFCGSSCLVALHVERWPAWLRETNSLGCTPLHMACKSRKKVSAAMVHLLLNDGETETLAAATDSQGHLPIHSIIHEHANADVVYALLHAYPATTAVTREGDTALHLACLRCGVPEEVGVLLANQLVLAHYRQSSSSSTVVPAASPFEQRNKRGETCLDILMARFGTPSPGTTGVYKGGLDTKALGICRCIIRLAAATQAAPRCSLLSQGEPVKVSEGERHMLVLQPLLAAALSIGRLPCSNLRPLNIHFLRLLVDDATALEERDTDGNLPLHIEARLPLLHEEDGADVADSIDYTPCTGYHGTSLGLKRCALLGFILNKYPAALEMQNSEGLYPLGLMMLSGHPWQARLTESQQSNCTIGVCDLLLGCSLSVVCHTLSSIIKKVMAAQSNEALPIKASRHHNDTGGKTSSVVVSFDTILCGMISRLAEGEISEKQCRSHRKKREQQWSLVARKGILWESVYLMVRGNPIFLNRRRQIE